MEAHGDVIHETSSLSCRLCSLEPKPPLPDSAEVHEGESSSVELDPCCHVNSSDVSISQVGKLRPGDVQHFAHSYKQNGMDSDFILSLPDLIWNTATYWFSVLHTSALRSWFLEFFQFMKIQSFKLGHLKFFIWLLNLVKSLYSRLKRLISLPATVQPGRLVK